MKLTIEQITEIQSNLVWHYRHVAQVTMSENKSYGIGVFDGMKFMLGLLGYEIKTELSNDLKLKIYVRESEDNA